MLSSLVLAALLTSAIFGDTTTLALELAAPFNDLFAHGSDEQYSVDGILTVLDDNGHAASSVNVAISVRGHTSTRRDECSFPKLKLAFPSSSRAQARANGAVRSLRIGTHCGEAPDDRLTKAFGRLANEQSPMREVFAYRLLAALDVATLRARPARIAYRYTDPRQDKVPSQDRPIVRNAMLLESSDEAIDRVGGFGASTNTNSPTRPRNLPYGTPFAWRSPRPCSAISIGV
jgi:hypothetical protein